MDLRLVSDDGDVLQLEAAAGSIRSDLLPDLRHFEDLLGPDGYARKVSLSLAAIALIDTFRMSWLLSIHKRFRRAGGKLVVHSIQPRVMEFLGVVRFECVLYLAEDEAAALDLLHAEDLVGDSEIPVVAAQGSTVQW
jgi:anti-anti-sigma regulatory factor